MFKDTTGVPLDDAHERADYYYLTQALSRCSPPVSWLIIQITLSNYFASVQKMRDYENAQSSAVTKLWAEINCLLLKKFLSGVLINEK